MQLKILSYNIHKGFTFFSRKFFLAQLKQILKTMDLDLVFLQEIHGKLNFFESKINSQHFEFLADQIWDYYAYGKNAVYDEGDHGNAILSKYPIVYERNYNISTNRFESRGLLHSKIHIPNYQDMVLNVFNTHLNLFLSGRLRQIEMLAQFIESEVKDYEPLIIAGDFNDWTHECSYYLEKRLGLKEVYKNFYNTYAPSFPSFYPILSLDRIFVRNVKILNVTLLSDAPWNTFSDHVGLMTVLEF
jgi:endonuclease/exonuclease/phosphatase family metal-dependent hydrolase